MRRQLITSGSPYEKSFGISRAVKAGDTIRVSGTAPISADGTTACPGDAYGQAKRCFEIILSAIEGSPKWLVFRRTIAYSRAGDNPLIPL